MIAQVDSIVNWIEESPFERKTEWFNKERVQNKDSMNFIKTLTQATLRSFKNKKYISSNFIADVINISGLYEFDYCLRTYSRFDSVPYPITLSFINELLSIKDISNIQLRVLLLEAQNKYMDSNNYKRYSDVLEKNLLEIITLKEDTQEENSLKYYNQMLYYAQVLAKRKKLESSENYYKYIAAAVRGIFPMVKQKYFDSYYNLFIESEKGLIDCRRGNKAKLKELNKYAFVHPVLTAYYEKAMLEVGEKVDWDKD